MVKAKDDLSKFFSYLLHSISFKIDKNDVTFGVSLLHVVIAVHMQVIYTYIYTCMYIYTISVIDWLFLFDFCSHTFSKSIQHSCLRVKTRKPSLLCFSGLNELFCP